MGAARTRGEEERSLPPGPSTPPLPGLPLLWGPCEASCPGPLSRGPSQPPNTLHDRLHSPQACSRWLLQPLPALRGLAQLLCLKLMRPQGHPAALEKESRLCHYSSLNNPLLASSTSHPGPEGQCGEVQPGFGSTPHQIPALTIFGSCEGC